MLENEQDFILPDDFATPEANEEAILPDETVDTVEDTTDTVEQQETVTEQPRIKVKYNHEEKELAIDEAVPFIQKGMNYDKLQERVNQLQNDPAFTFLRQLASEEGMEVQEYIEAVRTHRENLRQQELINKGIPPEIAQEILESRKEREQRKAQETQKQQEERQNREFIDFLNHFKQAEGRDFNPDSDKLPQEVWEAHAQGKPLKDAYLEHENRELRTKLKIQKQNEENRAKAPIGSVTSHGSTEVASEDDFMRGFNSF